MDEPRGLAFEVREGFARLEQSMSILAKGQRDTNESINVAHQRISHIEGVLDALRTNPPRGLVGWGHQPEPSPTQPPHQADLMTQNVTVATLKTFILVIIATIGFTYGVLTTVLGYKAGVLP